MKRAAKRKDVPASSPIPEAWPASAIEFRALSKLKAFADNARHHTDAQVAAIAAAIKEWGFTNPLLIDETDTIIAGHARALAAKRLEIAAVPVIVARGWSEAQKRAYVIADNKLALNASWDMEKLSKEALALADMFDIKLAGFSDEDIASLKDYASAGTVTEIHTAPVDDVFWISMRGPLALQAEALGVFKSAYLELNNPAIKFETGTIAMAP